MLKKYKKEAISDEFTASIRALVRGTPLIIQVYRMLFRDKLLDAFCSVSIPANIFIGFRSMKSSRPIVKIGVLVYSYKKIRAY